MPGLSQIEVRCASVRDGVVEADNELDVALFVELEDELEHHLGQDYGERGDGPGRARVFARILILRSTS